MFLGSGNKSRRSVTYKSAAWCRKPRSSPPRAPGWSSTTPRRSWAASAIQTSTRASAWSATSTHACWPRFCCWIYRIGSPNLLCNFISQVFRQLNPTSMVIWITKLRVFERYLAKLYNLRISWDSPPMNMRIRRIFSICMVHVT